jgi:hypothetical protein
LREFDYEKREMSISKTVFHYSQLAKKITPRADDVVRSMYAPLDARLLEARTVALVLSVTNLALVIKYSSSCSRDTHEWIDQALSDMDKHLEVRFDS